MQYSAQWAMRGAMARADQALTPTLLDFAVTTVHSLIGLGVLILTLWRWQLRRKGPVPVGNGQLSGRWALLARLWHVSIYLAIVLMAGSGALAYYLEMPIAARWHGVGKWILGILVIGHMLAGLVHWLVLRDGVVQGMFGNPRHADTMTSSERSSDHRT